MNTDALTTQIAISSIIIWLMNKLKKSRFFPFMTEFTERTNKWVGVIIAGLVSLGIHTQYGFDHDTGVFSLTISGLMLGSILDHGKDWILAWVIQHYGYQASKTLKE